MQCIVCDHDLVTPFLDLGETALANRFLTEEELVGQIEPQFPLRLSRCEQCGHVQLMEHVPPSAMFDEYLYISGVSTTLRAHLHDLARDITQARSLQEGDLVIDVGANDGCLLEGFIVAQRALQPSVRSIAPHTEADSGAPLRVLGIDPATNLRHLAEAKGVPIFTGYFGEESAREIASRHGQAALITATNVFPHIPRLDDFMAGVDALLTDNGALVIEAHYLRDMFEQGAFDTVYHEHVSYWSLTTMCRLFERYGFGISSAQRVPLHHGQLRVTVQRSGVSSSDDTVRAILDAEAESELLSEDACRRFARHAHEIKRELTAALAQLRSEGAQVVGYGAPAKGNTLLSFLELGQAELPYIADRSPLKQGRFAPGSHIPIVAPDRIFTDQPDYVLILAWNFVDEIVEQLSAYQQAGGRFILPVPQVQII